MVSSRSLLAALLAPVVLLVASCTSGMQCGPSSEPGQRDQCVSTGGPAEAVGTAAAATAAWGVEGCRVNGCHPPYTCNDDTGMCERMRCSEGQSCPSPFECDFVEGRCE